MGRKLSEWRGEWKAPDGNLWDVVLEWAEVDGRAECVGIAFRSRDGRPITTAILRGFHMRHVDAVREHIVTSVDPPDAATASASDMREYAHTLLSFLEEPKRRPLRGRNGRQLSPEEALKEVASIYNDAMKRGHKPTRAVSKALKLSPSAAAKRVARARKEKLIDPVRKLSEVRGRPRGEG